MKKLITILFFVAIGFAANAQTDTTVTNLLILDGSASNDIGNVNGAIVKYQWAQLSGPVVTIPHSNSKIDTVKVTQVGIYNFQLTVTNKVGLTDSQVIEVPVLSGDKRPIAKIKLIGVIKLPPEK